MDERARTFYGAIITVYRLVFVTVSASYASPSGRVEMEVLPWMKALCSEEFYEKCTKRHEKQKGGQIQSRSPVYNIFCIDCEVKVCACCQLPHDGHALLQVRAILVGSSACAYPIPA